MIKDFPDALIELELKDISMIYDFFSVLKVSLAFSLKEKQTKFNHETFYLV